MLEGKVRDHVVGAGPLERKSSSAGGHGIQAAGEAGAGRLLRDACRNFARAVDWRYVSRVMPRDGDSGLEDLRVGHLLSENHEALHSGMYINVSVVRGANALLVKGGCYDRYLQPRNVYTESVPLSEVTGQALGHLLMEMHDRLGRSDRTD